MLFTLHLQRAADAHEPAVSWVKCDQDHWCKLSDLLYSDTEASKLLGLYYGVGGTYVVWSLKETEPFIMERVFTTNLIWIRNLFDTYHNPDKVYVTWVASDEKINTVPWEQ